MTDIFAGLQAEIEALERAGRESLAGLLDLPHELVDIVHMLAHRGEIDLREIALKSGMGLHEVQEVLDRLVEQGHLEVQQVEGEIRHRVSLAREHGRKAPSNMWEVLGGKLE